MDQQEQIFAGKICPYCLQNTQFVDSSIVYNGKSFGMIYLCQPCRAWVGVHKGTNRALGRLAKEELRILKKEAHAWFDPLWQMDMKNGLDKLQARTNAYKWLMEKMNLPRELAHIGMFSEDQCTEVIKHCKHQYKILAGVKRIK